MNGFNDEFFEMKDFVKNILIEEGLENLHDNLKEAILNEFSAKVEDYNMANDTTLSSTSPEYRKLLLATIKFVLENNKDVAFRSFNTYDVIEDDYSEQSDAQIHM